MGGIQTTTGIFSGIDSGALIQQLLQIESRPKILAQQHLIKLQSQQNAFLDINTQLSALKTAAASFRVTNSFDVKTANTSNKDVLTATASTGAQAGSYNFLVDRLVSTQQLLSRGFVDQDTSAIGLDSITLEGAEARLDRDTSLSDLNDGNGIDRGKIMIDDGTGAVEIDLSKVGTVQELLDEINQTAGLSVTASVSNGRFVIDGATSATSVAGDETAESLGLDSGSASVSGGKLTGGVVYGLGSFTTLSSLNDGRGVTFDTGIGGADTVFDMTIAIDGGTEVKIRLGDIYEFQDTDDDGEDDTFVITDAAESTIGGVIDRINAQLADAGYSEVTASVDTENGLIQLSDTSGRDLVIADASGTQTASDLGLAGTYTGGSAIGDRILAGMNSTLLSSINGGDGLGEDSQLDLDLADGSSFNIALGGATTLTDVITAINDGTGGAVTASLNSTGTGLKIVDNTTGANSLVISGPGEKGAAQALGIDGTFADGVATGSNLQLAYMGRGTRLAELNEGSGIGTGDMLITDATGAVATITIDDNMLTLGEVIDKINGAGLEITARMNDTGDGLVIEDTSAGGTVTIKIEDTEGSVGKKLNIAGEASGTGNDNFIDGSFETTIEFDANATLDDIVEAINSSGSYATATVINDGTGTTPFRLSLTSRHTGTDGRVVFDTGGFDLGFETLNAGNDAKIFYGSTDPADAIMLKSSSNTLDNVIQGVTIDLKSVSTEPVTLSIAKDTESIETKVNEFVTAFNNVLEKIDTHTRYIEETKQRGALLGDGTAISLRQAMTNKLRATNDGFSNTYDSLVEVGLVVGEGGKLTFDQDKFRTALENDPEAVEALFTTREVDSTANVTSFNDGAITVTDPLADTSFTAIGVINQIEEFANDYISSIDGRLTLKSNAIGRQITLQQERIAQFDERLANRQLVLERQFLAMEQAIGQLSTQSSILNQIG